MLDTCEVNNFICYKIAEYFKKNNNINIFKKKTTSRKYNKIEQNFSKIKKIYHYIIKFLNFMPYTLAIFLISSGVYLSILTISIPILNFTKK